MQFIKNTAKILRIGAAADVEAPNTIKFQSSGNYHMKFQ